MKITRAVFLFLASISMTAFASFAQTDTQDRTKPSRQAVTPRASSEYAGPAGTNPQVTRERRAQAYAKLLEGQRYIWKASPARMTTGSAAYSRLAKQALQKAIELDPELAEAHTALAELAITANPVDLEQAIKFSSTAISINPDNFGGHRILARLYTFQSKLNNGVIDPIIAAKAIAGWKEVTRLDPRNAEAWAFLAEFYDKTGKPEDHIKALQSWISSATPLETQFYRRVMGPQETLTTERASLKLGTALMSAGRSRDAIEVLSTTVADDPQNVEAVELLREAIESSNGRDSAVALEPLQQAVYANPDNTTLINLLTTVQVRAGNLEKAVSGLQAAIKNLGPSDGIRASQLQVTLGDLYAEANQHQAAAEAYEEAVKIRGLESGKAVNDGDREFAMLVFEKLIDIYKRANRPNDVRLVIERARKLLGDGDLFADRQLISFYREFGNRSEALSAVRAVRLKIPNDYGFLRLEASILTESGQVDDGVLLIRSLIGQRASGGPDRISAALSMYDDFSNYLFISQLFNQAGRGREAIEAAIQAFGAANGSERKQIAKLTLATAQQTSGDFHAAEITLREILKQTPGNPIAMNNLGYFLLERNESVTEAYELIRQAVRIDPTNPSYLDSLGWAHFKRGEFSEAEKFLLEAARRNSASPAIQEHLGDLYSKMGRSDQARRAWERALVLSAEKSDQERLKLKLTPGR